MHSRELRPPASPDSGAAVPFRAWLGGDWPAGDCRTYYEHECAGLVSVRRKPGRRLA